MAKSASKSSKPSKKTQVKTTPKAGKSKLVAKPNTQGKSLKSKGNVKKPSPANSKASAKKPIVKSSLSKVKAVPEKKTVKATKKGEIKAESKTDKKVDKKVDKKSDKKVDKVSDIMTEKITDNKIDRRSVKPTDKKREKTLVKGPEVQERPAKKLPSLELEKKTPITAAAPNLRNETAEKLSKKARAKKLHTQQLIAEALREAVMSTAGEKEVVLTNADGLRYCKVSECDELSTSDGYCRFHYLLNWKKIQLRKKILVGDKLDRYIEELTARYPDKYLEVIKKDLASEKEFLAAIQELEIDDSGDEGEFEDDARTYIDEVRGVSTGGDEEEF